MNLAVEEETWQFILLWHHDFQLITTYMKIVFKMTVLKHLSHWEIHKIYSTFSNK